MKKVPAAILDHIVSPYYTFVFEKRDFFIPTISLQGISPVLFLMAHHVSSNVVWLEDEFSILYNFYIAGILPQQHALMPDDHRMLANYLLNIKFKDFLSI